jgi:hypothetical protein
MLPISELYSTKNRYKYEYENEYEALVESLTGESHSTQKEYYHGATFPTKNPIWTAQGRPPH